MSVFDLGSLCLPVELVGPDPRGILEILTTKDGRFAYSVSEFRGVQKHDLRTGEQLFAIRDWMRSPRCIALRPPDERELAIGYESGRYEVVDTETGDLLRRSLLPREYVRPPFAKSFEQILEDYETPDPLLPGNQTPQEALLDLINGIRACVRFEN